MGSYDDMESTMKCTKCGHYIDTPDHHYVCLDAEGYDHQKTVWNKSGNPFTPATDVVTEVIDGRRSVYGNPEEVFPRHAQVWSAIIGHPVTAEQVALCLLGYKLIRTADTPDYSDNSDDIEGYLDIFRGIVGNNMIHARSVSEYLEKKERSQTTVEQPMLFDRDTFKEN